MASQPQMALQLNSSLSEQPKSSVVYDCRGQSFSCWSPELENGVMLLTEWKTNCYINMLLGTQIKQLCNMKNVLPIYDFFGLFLNMSKCESMIREESPRTFVFSGDKRSERYSVRTTWAAFLQISALKLSRCRVYNLALCFEFTNLNFLSSTSVQAAFEVRNREKQFTVLVVGEPMLKVS